MVFSFENRHGGPAPTWIIEPSQADEIRSYFENGHGEQWLASASRERLLISCGDAGWRTVRVDEPNYAALTAEVTRAASPGFHGLVLRQEERMWLAGVLLAARRE